jgi:hypothetical protein
MKIFKILLASLLIISLNSCNILESQDVSAFSGYTIKSGQSFGFCIGKCYSEITINGQNVELLIKERVIGGGEDTKYKYAESLPTTTVNGIQKSLEIDKFFALNEVYGCPDCSDGGAEWIEIITDKDKSHKVTFESGKSIPEINDLIVTLRQERQRLVDKYAKN